MSDAAAAVGTPDKAQALTAARDTGAVEAVFANFRQYLLGWDDEGREVTSGVDHFRSGVGTPQFNGVVRVRSLSAVGQAVATVRRNMAGLPWWWWVGPDSPEGTADALPRYGGHEFAALPVMVRSLDHTDDPTEAPAGLRIETVQDGVRLAEVVATYRTSMGIARGLETEMVRIESTRRDNADIVRLAAVLDGRVVGSTVVIAAHGIAGIFLVHVADACRRLGVGGALTAAALRVGREHGMRSAALVASPAGEPLYRRFGFTTVSEYRLFTFPA
ncbi:GNAT family N-acetyltransferase [Streptomyces sp. NPDC059582]|uniref:GNAT family N-acetyltransferase n=1 Tax=Streptomyces sp. NPDC059582 TaxID=3346875 RepID=UPI003684E31A